MLILQRSRTDVGPQRPAIGAKMLGAAMDLYDRWKGHPRVTVNLAAHAVDTCSDGFLREIAELASRHSLVVSTHLGQSIVELDRVRERTGKTSTEVLEEVGLLNSRLMGGHCICLTESDIARMARSGAHVVHIPKCSASSGRFAPTPKLKRAGINIALATDTQHGDMVELMRWALVTARVQTGGVDDEWQPHHVFHMATLGGAKALGMADSMSRWCWSVAKAWSRTGGPRVSSSVEPCATPVTPWSGPHDRTEDHIHA
jgi:5-methylthioadenosine/S-adenosylhomocysteine deaminase